MAGNAFFHAGKGRLKNRELLWDVELKAEEQAAFAAASVAKKPYTYYSYDD